MGTMQTLGSKSVSAVKKLKTMNELRDAQLALLQDIASGELTSSQWRPIQNALNALQKKWQKQAQEASTPADFEALKAIFGSPKSD